MDGFKKRMNPYFIQLKQCDNPKLLDSIKKQVSGSEFSMSDLYGKRLT